MKKASKFLFGAAMLAAVIGFAGCLMEEGEMETSGDKWKSTMTLDYSDADGETPLYKRSFKQFPNSSKKVTKFKSTITVATDGVSAKVKDSGKKDTAGNELYTIDEKGADKTNAVVGIMFDLHEVEKKYDFVLVGFRPSDNKFYIEHYTDVESNKLAKDMDNPEPFTTSNGSLGSYDSITVPGSTADWISMKNAPEKTTIEVQKNLFQKESYDAVKFDVTVTQDKGVYTINVNGTEKTFEAVAKDKDGKDFKNDKGERIGGLAMYGNAALGTKIRAVFAQDEEETEGLFEEVEE